METPPWSAGQVESDDSGFALVCKICYITVPSWYLETHLLSHDNKCEISTILANADPATGMEEIIFEGSVSKTVKTEPEDCDVIFEGEIFAKNPSNNVPSYYPTSQQFPSPPMQPPPPYPANGGNNYPQNGGANNYLPNSGDNNFSQNTSNNFPQNTSNNFPQNSSNNFSQNASNNYAGVNNYPQNGRIMVTNTIFNNNGQQALTPPPQLIQNCASVPQNSNIVTNPPNQPPQPPPGSDHPLQKFYEEQEKKFGFFKQEIPSDVKPPVGHIPQNNYNFPIKKEGPSQSQQFQNPNNFPPNPGYIPNQGMTFNPNQPSRSYPQHNGGCNNWNSRQMYPNNSGPVGNNVDPPATSGVHVCDLCGRGFESTLALVYHASNYHKISPVASGNVTRVRGNNEGGDEPQFPCQLCEKKYRAKGSLHVHMRKHHKK